MKNLLMVSYFFPPMGGAGVQRVLKFARYLPGFDWMPTILTAQPANNVLLDTSLAAEIPDEAAILRAKGLTLSRRIPWRLRSWIINWLLVVDEQIGWYRPATALGRYELSKSKTAAIFSTSAPYTSHLVGMALKRASGLPWVADFRDPWSDNPSRTYPTFIHAKLNRYLEKKVCMQADKVLVTTPESRTAITKRFPEVSREKIVYLPNGFDSTDFLDLPPAEKDGEIFTIVHNGTFYSKGLTPDTFLRALNISISSGKIPRERIRLHLVGNLGKPSRLAIERSGVADRVVEFGYLPHHESLRHLLAADLLLMVNHPAKSGEQIVPAKLYEYFYTGIPVLLLTNPGATANLSNEFNMGVVLPPDDANAVAEELIKHYQLWQCGDKPSLRDKKFLENFERRHQTHYLAQILDDLQ